MADQDDQLPEPPVGPEVELSDFGFMPLEVSRLRRSKAWLICKRRPELAFYMVNLWTAAWHERPAGSLDDDDDVLSDVAMCPPKEWPKVRADVLRGWVKCSDGRLYHTVVIEKVREAWRSKMHHAYDRECGRLRKAAERAGQKQSFVPPTFEEWDRTRTSNGNHWMSSGQAALSNGHTPPVQRTSTECPPENALKGEVRDRESKGKGYYLQGQNLSGGRPVDSTSSDQAAFQRLKAAYPKGIYRQSDWLEAEREARQRIDEGVTWEELRSAVERYSAQVEATGRTGTEAVLSPRRFFTAKERCWVEPFPLPAAARRTQRQTAEEHERESAQRLANLPGEDPGPL